MKIILKSLLAGSAISAFALLWAVCFLLASFAWKTYGSAAYLGASTALFGALSRIVR